MLGVVAAVESDLGAKVRRGPMLAVLLAGEAMASMDGSIVSVSAQSIRTDLGASGTAIQLIVSGYLLTTGVLLVTCARLGSLLGYRRVFLLGLAWFTLASLLCGLAPNGHVMVLSRVAQGVGAALLVPQVFSLIQVHWDGAARRKAIGLYSMVMALGVALGQIVGGLVVTVDLFGLGWRPAFLLNVPVGVLLIAIGRRTFGIAAETDSASTITRPRLDVSGVLLLTGAMSALIVPLIFGPDHGWPAWAPVALVSGAALLLMFVRHERSAPDPLLDLAALRPAGVKPGLAACWIVMGCYTAFLLTLTLHLQSELGFSPLAAGAAFVPYALGFGGLSLSWHYYPQRVQAALPVAGPIAFAVGAVALVALAQDGWPTLGAVPLLLMSGAGHAAGYGPTITRVTLLVDARLASALSGLNSTGPLLASVTAVAGLGSVYFAAANSAEGLTRVAGAVAVMLAIGAACALRITPARLDLNRT